LFEILACPIASRTKQSANIGIKSALGDPKAIFYRIMMAKGLVATRVEIRETILDSQIT
jgi:hypothetical protein